MRRIARGAPLLAARAAAILALALGSIAVSLWLTPMQKVVAAGQTLRIGVAAPSWTLSGPGELDLFGQRIATATQFVGPVRPRLKLAQITLTAQLNQFAADGSASAHALEGALVAGWDRFFVWQIVVAGLAAVVLFGALAGWLRRGWRRSLLLIAIGLVVTEGLNVGAIMATAYTAPAKLRQVDSLAELVGVEPPPAVPGGPTVARHTEIKRVAVVGDSTAAGLGNRPVSHPSADDTACGRSRDAFAVDLAKANGWQVTNLACSGATIRAGLLGPQIAGGRTLPAQLASPAVADADLIVVSIGANDVGWSLMLKMCAVSLDCANSAEQALFTQQLTQFSLGLLQLVTQLQLLGNHPAVVVNEYYDPFAGDITCLASAGLTKPKRRTLHSELAALNDVLAQTAKTAGFFAAHPDFSGHGPCSRQPYVQGMTDPAPLHPTASGELAIALAADHALLHAPSP